MTRTPKVARNVLSWRDSLPSGIVLCGLIFIVYFSVGFFGFILWDDDHNFILNPWVKGFFGTQYWAWAWTTRLLNVFQPISWIFLQAQYTLVPQSPAQCIHVVSLFLHMANAIIVFILCRRLGDSSGAKKNTAALCGALYFGLHPLQCEAVAWASCQPYLLASFLGGLSLLCFVKSLETSKNILWYRLSVALFAASLLSKSIFVSLPAIVGILRLTRERSQKVTFRIVFWIFRRDWLFWLCSLCAFMLALWARADASGKDAVQGIAIVKLLPAFFGFYIVKTVFPVPLLPLYALSSATVTEIFLGVALLIGTFACLMRSDRRKLGLSLLALIVLLMPGLAAAMTEGTLFGDRYAYLANAVVGLIISMAIYQLEKVKGGSNLPAWLCAVLLSVALAIPSRRQIALWSDSVGFWQHAIQYGAALSHKAHTNLGIALAERGLNDEAATHFERALEIDADSAEAHVNLGIVLRDRGRIDDAITHFRKAIIIKPLHADAYYNLGFVLTMRGEVEDAIAQYRRALEIRPDLVEARNNLGLRLAGRGQTDEAIAHYQRALEIQPDFAEVHNNLGFALAGRGQTDEAIAHYRRALEIQPDFAVARRNLETLLRRRP